MAGEMHDLICLYVARCEILRARNKGVGRRRLKLKREGRVFFIFF